MIEKEFQECLCLYRDLIIHNPNPTFKLNTDQEQGLESSVNKIAQKYEYLLEAMKLQIAISEIVIRYSIKRFDDSTKEIRNSQRHAEIIL